MTRDCPEGSVPLISVEGTAFECGHQLGIAWRNALKVNAERARGKWEPWWMNGEIAKLVERKAPFLPDLYRGMAKGAGIPEEQSGCQPIASPLGSCTSFAVHPDATVDGSPISGQTKDTGADRIFYYQVLRMKPKDAPGYLTLTYPGELFGHGFSSTGMSIFRNSLYVRSGRSAGRLLFEAFGLLAIFSSSLEEAAELAREYGVRGVSHVTIAEGSGRALGFEMCSEGASLIRGRAGVYAHANHTVAAGFRLLEDDECRAQHRKGASEHRQRRLYELMEQERGRLTPQLMLRLLSDHQNFPKSICSHRGAGYLTSAAVVAEPTRGLLHVTRGAPCQNWPRTYQL